MVDDHKRVPPKTVPPLSAVFKDPEDQARRGES
jgi:hypothetical protein